MSSLYLVKIKYGCRLVVVRIWYQMSEITRRYYTSSSHLVEIEFGCRSGVVQHRCLVESCELTSFHLCDHPSGPPDQHYIVGTYGLNWNAIPDLVKSYRNGSADPACTTCDLVGCEYVGHL